MSSCSRRSNCTAVRPSTFFSTSNQFHEISAVVSAWARTRKVFVLNTPTVLASKPRGSRNSSRTCRRPSAWTGIPPLSPATLSHTSTITSAGDSRKAPRIDASTVAPRLSRFVIHTTLPPCLKNASSKPDRRAASTRSPCPVAYVLGSPCESRKRVPSGVRRRLSPWRNVFTCNGACWRTMASRMGPSVASLVMSHMGIARPAVRASAAFSRRRRSRKVFPSRASTSALTTPPMRVAIPPAITTNAISPRDIAVRPSSASLSASGVPAFGASAISWVAGPRTSPATLLRASRRVATSPARLAPSASSRAWSNPARSSLTRSAGGRRSRSRASEGEERSSDMTTASVADAAPEECYTPSCHVGTTFCVSTGRGGSRRAPDVRLRRDVQSSYGPRHSRERSAARSDSRGPPAAAGAARDVGRGLLALDRPAVCLDSRSLGGCTSGGGCLARPHVRAEQWRIFLRAGWLGPDSRSPCPTTERGGVPVGLEGPAKHEKHG